MKTSLMFFVGVWAMVPVWAFLYLTGAPVPLRWFIIVTQAAFLIAGIYAFLRGGAQ